MNSLDSVLPGLYLGDINAASDVKLLSTLGITHILTVELAPIPQSVISAFPDLAYFHIEITDSEKSDLLQRLPSAVTFIRTGLETSSVLVHCYHGLSRSASVVIAYLMKYHRLTYIEALTMIRTVRPDVEPNDGFVKQLLLYRHMNCELQRRSLPFRLYKLSVLREKMMISKMLCKSDFEISKTTSSSSIRCRRCRVILFYKDDVILPHNKGLMRDMKWWDLVSNIQSFCTKGIFIEPFLHSMFDEALLRLSDKLRCFQCFTKLGHFSWSNVVECPCGTKSQPGFWINLSRVDL